jgi:hypothetical protein
MPAVSATPPEVVAAYVDALDAYDCNTARAQWLSDTAAPQMWCSAVRRAQIVSEMAPVHKSARIDVPVMLNIRWRPFKDDGSIEGNPFGWTYILSQDSGSAARIGDI